MSQQKRQIAAKQASAPQQTKKTSKRPSRAEQHEKFFGLQFVVPVVQEGEYFQQVNGYGDQRFSEATIYVGA
ncbi:hypothetical protein [Roseateles sp.]|uniref:hypothetical protein n=1 Tax=Roseateles sp. TaxID=1971397 RepID=UPI00286B3C02|nr:hypothetical protein [Roseateles sp.]